MLTSSGFIRAPEASLPRCAILRRLTRPRRGGCVAEIAHTKVWADGQPLEVERLPDGLEARLGDRRPAVVSAFADRGIVNYMGDSFIIYLAAYSQTHAIDANPALKLGLGDDQVRLLLIAKGDGPPVVQALWRGKPAADAPVKLFHGRETPDRAADGCPRRDPVPRSERRPMVPARRRQGQDAWQARRAGLHPHPLQGHAGDRRGSRLRPGRGRLPGAGEGGPPARPARGRSPAIALASVRSTTWATPAEP